MCTLSHTFSPLLGNLSHIPLPMLKRMPAWMLGHVVFGRARGIWGLQQQSAFFNVRVFRPNAPSYRGLPLETCYRRHENQKHQAYEQRVSEIENGSFTPPVFSNSGGMGKAAKITYERLASLLSIKQEQPYSLVMGWLRCRLSFSLIRSAVMCLRGCRSKKGHIPLPDTHIGLVVHEGRLPLSS